jgi:hypothetical protein
MPASIPNAAIPGFVARPPLGEPFAKVHIPTIKKAVQPQSTSTESSITEDNIEAHVRKLEEGYGAIQSWAQMQTTVLEKLKEDVDECAQRITAFLAEVDG